jgi:hypothetical protein
LSGSRGHLPNSNSGISQLETARAHKQQQQQQQQQQQHRGGGGGGEWAIRFGSIESLEEEVMTLRREREVSHAQMESTRQEMELLRADMYSMQVSTAALT